jgi:hypothetical protein
MKIITSIPLTWAKKVREAGMIKNLARKILKETERNSELSQESMKKGSSGPEMSTGQTKPTSIKSAAGKLDVF